MSTRQQRSKRATVAVGASDRPLGRAALGFSKRATVAVGASDRPLGRAALGFSKRATVAVGASDRPLGRAALGFSKRATVAVGASDRPLGRAALGSLDTGETVALVARSRRELLLGSHRHRLGREDLEDCYSQATLELLTRARRGGQFAGTVHVANALEQKFLSRVQDRLRALSGRSPIQAALAGSLVLGGVGGGVDVADVRADVERLTFLRHDLRSIARLSHALSSDQRLVLASELSGEPGCAEFCRIHGWSAEKYRKVGQRGRARLLALLADDGAGPFRNRCPVRPRSSD